jgi:hypothetical protein
MTKSMSIVGGLDMYRGLKRYKSDVSPEGRKVLFLDDNGYDIEREHARKYFSKGDVLTVKEIYVGRNSSEVKFMECPGKLFNTVMFADKEGGTPDAD